MWVQLRAKVRARLRVRVRVRVRARLRVRLRGCAGARTPAAETSRSCTVTDGGEATPG